ncbi:hypothetical protein TNCV_3378721 [Trichonephila clavipes]|nr:hypothetical protein TNCV_3378721 [Trichonephila clavipes]
MLLALALSTMLGFARFHPNFEGEYPGDSQRPPRSLPVPPTSREDLRLDGCSEYFHAAKALYIYQHLCLLRGSIPWPTAPLSVSLNTTPDQQFVKHLINVRSQGREENKASAIFVEPK